MAHERREISVPQASRESGTVAKMTGTWVDGSSSATATPSPRCCWAWPGCIGFGVILGPIAIGLGLLAKSQINRSGQPGRAPPRIGIALGLIALRHPHPPDDPLTVRSADVISAPASQHGCGAGPPAPTVGDGRRPRPPRRARPAAAGSRWASAPRCSRACCPGAGASSPTRARRGRSVRSCRRAAPVGSGGGDGWGGGDGARRGQLLRRRRLVRGQLVERARRADLVGRRHRGRVRCSGWPGGGAAPGPSAAGWP